MGFVYLLSIIILCILIYYYFSRSPKQRKELNKQGLKYGTFIVLCILSSYTLDAVLEDFTVLDGLFVSIPGLLLLLSLVNIIRQRKKEVISSQLVILIFGFFFLYITYNIMILGADGTETIYRGAGFLIIFSVVIMIISLISIGITRSNG